ncbi:MAG: hypothetical protein QG567_352 [Campylobacterota bacterium]|nr:hypothetical protein [Campylobacterota bacterium]
MILATTNDGQEIILNEDGTWCFASSMKESQNIFKILETFEAGQKLIAIGEIFSGCFNVGQKVFIGGLDNDGVVISQIEKMSNNTATTHQLLCGSENEPTLCAFYLDNVTKDDLNKEHNFLTSEKQNRVTTHQLKSSDLQELTFRQTKWGMSKNQVKQSENLEIILDENDLLAYEGKVAGFPSYIVYNFINDELATGSYQLIHEHVKKSDFIYDFENIKNNLIKKYGQPSKDNRYFTDDVFEDKPAEWSQSLERGGLSFFTNWIFGETELMLSLCGENYKINLGISYSSTEYKNRLILQNDEKLLDDL